MSIFNELLPKINEISNSYTKSFNDDLKAIFEAFDKFEEDYIGRGKARDKNVKDKCHMTTLQSIDENEDEPTNAKPNGMSSNTLNGKVIKRNSKVDAIKDDQSKTENSNKQVEDNKLAPRGAKKRSKDEVEGMSSPEQEKRQKRNASVRAQNNISKQIEDDNETNLLSDKSCVVILSPLVNVNLTQKLRREVDTNEKKRGKKQNHEEDKENAEPTMIIEIKQEKISLPLEPMDMESLSLNVEVKQEPHKDEVAMPPPAMPIPKPRKNAAKDKGDESSEDESSGRRRNTRNKKQTDTMAPPPAPAPRSTRASSRASSRASARKPVDEEPTVPVQPEPRPKRTRAKKKGSESSEAASETQAPPSATASPIEKSRPKRTRRGQKAAEKAAENTEPQEIPQPKSPTLKAERRSEPDLTNSPILTQKSKVNQKVESSKTKLQNHEVESRMSKEAEKVQRLDETRTIGLTTSESLLVSKDTDVNKTMVLANAVYEHSPNTPKDKNMNETVVLEGRDRGTMVLDKQKVIMDATVVIDKDAKQQNLTYDNSILTDDNSAHETQTPPKVPPPVQPTSAVKEKVQQFEELASRVTRTKTRAMAKKDDTTENHTPPDKISKAVLDADTLKKMNSLIFNSKPPQISSSACKPRTNIPTATKPHGPSSTSKLSSLSRHKEAADETLAKKEKEDARKKKEAMLEAKRELQRKKREDKMAAAAAARLAAEKERQLQALAAEKERTEKLAQLSNHRINKMKEVERKKQELARKVAETEERRRAEEVLRQQRLAEEQKRMEENRRKQMEEHEAMKKEAAIMAKEIEKRQKEYLEKQKKKLDEQKSYTPLKTPGTPGYRMEPVYLQDGFQHLNSDEEDDGSNFPVPAWSTSKARKQQLQLQYSISQEHVDRLFSVRIHSPDLREIFPNIERSRLKRTSSAVWRTPPNLRMPAVSE